MEIMYTREHKYRIDLSAAMVKELHAAILDHEGIDKSEYSLRSFRADVKAGTMPYMEAVRAWIFDNEAKHASQDESEDAEDIEMYI